jgi:hypothetical protein
LSFREGEEAIVNIFLKFVLVLIAPCAAALAQAVPSATGAGGLHLGNKLNYSFRYAQTAEFGSNLGNWQTSSLSAFADYANEKERLPFTLNYSGGYTWTLAGPSYTTGLFQRLFLSQGIDWRKWHVILSDDASYRPQSPITGFSGIPGIGEPIGGTVPSPPSSQSILTVSTHVVNNLAHGEIEDNLNYALSLNAGATSELLRYPDDNGLNMDTQMANAELAWRLNGRNSISSNYRFSQFSYPDHSFSFVSNSGLFGFTRDWSRKIETSLSIGPQWTRSSDNSVVPPSLGVAANGAINYRYRFVSADLIYSRAIGGGGGYLFGDQTDSFGAHFSRDFRSGMTIVFEGSLRRIAGLQNNGVTYAQVGGTQVDNRLGRYFNVFANYTVTAQSSSSTLPGNTLSGLRQVISFGITYLPRGTDLRR